MTKPFLRSRPGESGYAMMLAVFILFLLSISLALVGLSLAIRLRMVKAESEAVVRGALADAAFDEALAHLADSATYPGAPRHPLGDGQVQSRVLPVGLNQYHITAAGTYAGRTRRIQAVARRSPTGEITVESWRLDPVAPRGESSRES